MATEFDTIVERVKIETEGAGSAKAMAAQLDAITRALKLMGGVKADGAASSLSALAGGIKLVQQAEARLNAARQAQARLATQNRNLALRAQVETFDAKKYVEEQNLRAQLRMMQRGALPPPPLQAKQAQAAAGSVSMLGDAASSAGGFLQGFGKGLVGGIKALAAAEVAFVTAGAGLAVVTRTQVLDPLAHRQSLEGAAGKLLGKGGSGVDAVRESMMVANELGLDLFETSDQVVALLGRGFKMEGANNALDVVKGMADLKIVSPSVRTENLVTAIAQIKSKGKLQMEELQGQIGEAFDVSAVLSQIGKKLGGKTNEEVRKLISAGKIDADTGIAAVLGAIQEKTGQGLGEAARESSMSMGGLMGRLERYPDTVKALMQVDTSGVQRTFRTLWDAIDPETQGGRDLVAAAGRISQGLVNIFADVDSGDVRAFVEQLTGFLHGVGQQIETWGPVVRKAFGGFATGFGNGLQALERFFGDRDMKSSAEAWGQILGFIGTSLGTIAGVVVGVGAGFMSLGAVIVGGVGSAIAYLAELPGRGLAAGVGLIQGLINGVTSMAAAGVSAVRSFAKDVAGVLPSVLKQRSPSRLTFEDGENFGLGFIGGVKSQNDNARAAAGGFGAAALGGLDQGARPFALSQGGGGQGARGPTVFNMNDLAPSFSFPGISDVETARKAGKGAAEEFQRSMAAWLREVTEAA